MKKWALITGASQGIGYEFARVFAENGFNLVLLARDAPRLAQVAAEIKSRHPVEIKVLPVDLAKQGAALEILSHLQREQIDLQILVNNAGFGIQGAFAELNPQGEAALIQVNVTALVELTRLFLPGMIARGEGRILNVASIAAFLPGAYMALYYASKAFVHSFSCALSKELRGTGVTVTSLCPGMTRSQFHARSGQARVGGILMIMMQAEMVARIGYRALMAGKPIAIPGWLNKIVVFIARVTPTWLILKVSGRFIASPKKQH